LVSENTPQEGTQAAGTKQAYGNIGCFIVFSVIANIYNKKTKEPTLMELFTATEKLKKVFFLTTRDYSDYEENWPESVQRHLQRLMGDHLISVCTDTQFQ
jgi:hypothetical protein